MEQKKEDVLIEILQHQIECSKEEARRLLKKHQYNLVSAINEIKHGPDKEKRYTEEVIHVTGSQLIDTIKKLMRKTNLIHLTIWKDNKKWISLPVTLSLMVFWIYPLISSFAMIYLINSHYTIKILKLTG